MAHSDSHADHHIIPFKVLASVFGALIVLTVLTVAVAQIELGVLEIPIALGIALAKSTLVVMFFMALKYDKPVNSMVFTVGTVFVVVFLVFTLFDTAFRGDIGTVSTQTIQEEEAELERLREREPTPEQLRVTPSDYGQQGTGTGQEDNTN